MSVSKAASRKRKKNSWVQVSPEQSKEAILLLPFIGYLLLALTCLDYVFLLIPLNLFNSTWELNTIGGLVENVWAPLLGFLLIFYRPAGTKIKLREIKFLTWLSRLLLLLTVMYFLAVPLIISNTIRIEKSYFSQFNLEVEQQKTKVDVLEKQLNQLGEEELKAFYQQSQSQQTSALSIDSNLPLRQQLLNQLHHEQEQSFKQVETAYKQQKANLLKKSVKWGIGTIISGILFMFLWKYSRWTRTSSIINNKIQPENT
jgi:hypothetical protein